ncbi:MAG: monovalent cation/H(+) antiporter subunit G [Burkholderiaceae bacterium]
MIATLAQAAVGCLLLLSGLVAVASALGLWRLPDFFLRLHAPALTYTLGSWCVTLACILHFTLGGTAVTLHVWMIIILLSITAPVTTVLLARVGLFRGRRAGDVLPGELFGEQPEGAGRQGPEAGPPPAEPV